jgi:MscS family membrane protein
MMHFQFLGNPIENYFWFLGIIAVGFLFRTLMSKWISRVMFRLLKSYAKGEIGFENLLELIKGPLSASISLITIYFAFIQLKFPEQWNIPAVDEFGLRMILSKGFQISLCITVTWIILRLVDFLGLVFFHKAVLTASKSDDQIVPFIREAFKVLIVIFSIFFILGAIFKLDITSLIAGLGLGGLAIALAAKESLENLLGSFTIFFDKPFVIGDLIKIGDIEGNVERIGFRSTRIRTLEKTYVTVPNKKLIDTELDNLSLREVRRVKFDFGLKYTSQQNSIQNIISRIKKFILKHPDVTEECYVHLYAYKDFSISIRVIFFIKVADWETYMNAREQINFAIMDIVRNEGCDFSNPIAGVDPKMLSQDNIEQDAQK